MDDATETRYIDCIQALLGMHDDAKRTQLGLLLRIQALEKALDRAAEVAIAQSDMLRLRGIETLPLGVRVLKSEQNC